MLKQNRQCNSIKVGDAWLRLRELSRLDGKLDQMDAYIRLLKKKQQETERTMDEVRLRQLEIAIRKESAKLNILEVELGMLDAFSEVLSCYKNIKSAKSTNKTVYYTQLGNLWEIFYGSMKQAEGKHISSLDVLHSMGLWGSEEGLVLRDGEVLLGGLLQALETTLKDEEKYLGSIVEIKREIQVVEGTLEGLEDVKRGIKL